MTQVDTATMLAEIGAGTAAFFDADHPDAEILKAYEQYRRLKSWTYSMEDLNRGDWPDDDDARIDAVMADLEDGVTGNYATTPVSAALQLLMLIPRLEPERWVDRDLVDVGILPFGSGPYDFGICGNAKQLLTTAYALFDMEWAQALHAYEQSEANFDQALQLKGLVEAERSRLSGEGSQFLDGLEQYAQELEDRHSNSEEVNRLLRTPPPDWENYQRKAKIAMKEGMATYAAPWLARDVNLLMGRITPAKRRSTQVSEKAA